MGEARGRNLRMVGTQNGQPQPGGVPMDPKPPTVDLGLRIPAEAEQGLRRLYERAMEVRRRLEKLGKLGEPAEAMSFVNYCERLLIFGAKASAKEIEQMEQQVGGRLIMTPEEARRMGLF